MGLGSDLEFQNEEYICKLSAGTTLHPHFYFLRYVRWIDAFVTKQSYWLFKYGSDLFGGWFYLHIGNKG